MVMAAEAEASATVVAKVVEWAAALTSLRPWRTMVPVGALAAVSAVACLMQLRRIFRGRVPMSGQMPVPG